MMTLVQKMLSVKKLFDQNVRGRNVRDGKKIMVKKLGFIFGIFSKFDF